MFSGEANVFFAKGPSHGWACFVCTNILLYKAPCMHMQTILNADFALRHVRELFELYKECDQSVLLHVYSRCTITSVTGTVFALPYLVSMEFTSCSNSLLGRSYGSKIWESIDKDGTSTCLIEQAKSQHKKPGKW